MSLKTPEQYVESLNDGRVTYWDGERIDDITNHPKFRTPIAVACGDSTPPAETAPQPTATAAAAATTAEAAPPPPVVLAFFPPRQRAKGRAPWP